MVEKIFVTKQKLVKFLVGNQLWYVPLSLVTDTFISAVERLNNTEQGKIIEWTDEERKALLEEVGGHFAVHRPG